MVFRFSADPVITNPNSFRSRIWVTFISFLCPLPQFAFFASMQHIFRLSKAYILLSVLIAAFLLIFALTQFYYDAYNMQNWSFSSAQFAASLKRSVNQDKAREPRIFCWILTAKQFHRERADSIEDTWAKRCDKHVYMSSAGDEHLPAVKLPVAEGRDALWNKTKAAFSYIYDHEEIDQFDWFLKADDDTFVIVENLRLMLTPYSPDAPWWFGCAFHFMGAQKIYPSGGPGYVLSRAALRKFVEVGLRGNGSAVCDSTGIYEDVEMGFCMPKLNISAGDSRDAQGRHRFLPLSPDRSLSVLPQEHGDTWVRSYAQFPYESGPNCCSDLAVSYHYVNAKMMRAMDYMIYRLRVPGRLVGQEGLMQIAVANLGPNDAPK